MTEVTLYHNPACGTSRNVLAMIRNTGIEPRIIPYLQTPPTRDELVALIKAMGIQVRELLRQKGTPYDELQLGAWTGFLDEGKGDASCLGPLAGLEK